MFKKHFYIFLLLSFALTSTAQDTLMGNHNSLLITKGKHVIRTVVTVSKSLIVEPGASVELIEPGMIVCEGSVNINGVSKNIEIYGKKNQEGTGLVIKSIDSSSVIINNAVFTNLQMPLFFDFGWKRKNVVIENNSFIKNIGKVSVIQVLNPPFNYNLDSSYSSLSINSNLFADNNASIYFEDLKSDHLKIEFLNNAITNNTVYGFKNYNISTNVLYGRVDQFYNRFNARIEGNSFVGNYLIDNLADTIVQQANLGVYGTEKTFATTNNFWGATNSNNIIKGIYDQNINYSSPKIIADPILKIPNNLSPTHIYNIKNGETNFPFTDTLTNKIPLKSFVIESNNLLDLSKSILRYHYYIDDSSLKMVDTTLTFDIQAENEYSNKLVITRPANSNKKTGYYTLSNLLDVKNNYVSDAKIGYGGYLKELRVRKILDEIIKNKKAADTIKPIPKELDSVKNQFQKIEAPLKSRFEFGLFTGGAVFTGTISNKNIFQNELNIYNAFNINYTLYSNISLGLTISSFKLSNSDLASDNNEQIARGMRFSTSMMTISPSIQYDYIDNRLYTKARRIRPSVGFGLDIASFNPTGLYKGKEYNLQTLGTGGQLIDSTKGLYSLMALGYFVNFKVKYQINRFNSVGIHFSIHRSMSDYLDDVGPDEYPDINTLMLKTKSDPIAAAYFSNPSSRVVTKGQLRNSPTKASDGYINFGIFYSRRLFK
jgi:hypothetical protein